MGKHELFVSTQKLQDCPDEFIGAAGFITASLSKEDSIHCCTLLGIMLVSWRANEDEGLDAALVEGFYNSTIKTVGRVQYLEALRDLIDYANSDEDMNLVIIRNHRGEVYIEVDESGQ